MGNINIVQGISPQLKWMPSSMPPIPGRQFRAAGPELLAVCKQVPAKKGIRCLAGQARITRAGNLKAIYVIHELGPRYWVDEPLDQLLVSIYQNSLDLSMSHGCRSIAFPAISCGVYGYLCREAAEVALSMCTQPKYAPVTIHF